MKVKLKDVCSVIVPMRDKPKTFSNNPQDINWCRIEDIQGKYLEKSLSNLRVDKETIDSMNLKVFPKGTIICAVTGASIGTYAITSKDLITNQTFAGLVCKEELDNQYLFYLIKQFTKIFINKSVGCAQAYITRDTFENLEIELPNIEHQKKMVRLLYLIDEKIENNNKINKDIEELIKTIYQRWFIEYEFPDQNGKPYKTNGGRFIYNKELNQEIPVEWKVKKLKDLVNENRIAFDYSTIEKTIDLSVMPSNSISLNQINNSDNFSTNLFKMHKGDILFGGIRTYLKKAGIAPCDGTFAGTVFSYIPKNANDYNFVLSTFVSQKFFKYSEKISKGTKMPVVSSKDLLNYDVVYSDEIVKKFNEIINLKQVITDNVMENSKLNEFRDFLLPLLINGKINVDDIDI